MVNFRCPIGASQRGIRVSWSRRRPLGVAIANSRLIALDDSGVTFRWKDYRAKGRERHKVMTLASDEFIRRFLIHVLPGGFHRIRHYGLFANGGRAANLARARDLLDVPTPQEESNDADANADEPPASLLPWAKHTVAQQLT